MLTSVGVKLSGLCDMKKMCGQKGGLITSGCCESLCRWTAFNASQHQSPRNQGDLTSAPLSLKGRKNSPDKQRAQSLARSVVLAVARGSEGVPPNRCQRSQSRLKLFVIKPWSNLWPALQAA